MHAHMYIHACRNMPAHICRPTCGHTSVSIHVHLHTHTQSCEFHAYTSILTQIHTHMHTCMCPHIHTRISTCTVLPHMLAHTCSYMLNRHVCPHVCVPIPVSALTAIRGGLWSHVGSCALLSYRKGRPGLCPQACGDQRRLTSSHRCVIRGGSTCRH